MNILVDKISRVVKYVGGEYTLFANAVVHSNEGNNIDFIVSDYNTSTCIIETVDALPNGFVADKFTYTDGIFTPIL